VDEFPHLRERLPAPIAEFLDLRVNERGGGLGGTRFLHVVAILTAVSRLEINKNLE